MTTDPHRNDVHELTPRGPREAIPLPYEGVRKRCGCGRRFWTTGGYEHHWKFENWRALQGSDSGVLAHGDYSGYRDNGSPPEMAQTND